MQTITFVNFKGGVTKSSSAVNLGSALALLGHRVLIIDTDPQSHISKHVGVEANALNEGLEDILEGKNRLLADIIVESPLKNLFVAPSRRRLRQLSATLPNRVNKDALLAKSMRGLSEHFDFTLIDTPMDENIFSINGLYAGRYIIIPTVLEELSLDGINPTLDTIFSLQEAYEERDWDILGVLINKYDRRNIIENESGLTELETAFSGGDVIFNTRIRVDRKVARAVKYGQTIHQYEAKSKAAKDYTALANEVLDKLNTL